VCDRQGGDLWEDGPLLVDAFARLGVSAELVPWGGDFSGFDAAVIRGAWDYILDRGAFLDWAGSVPCPLFNPPKVLAWNTDKRYLRELAGAGVPVVPTTWSDEPGWAFPEGEFVVKPAVSAGGRWSARYGGRADWAAAAEHVRTIEATGDVAMIQPFVPTVESVGEAGTYVFGGVASHAIHKPSVLDLGVPAGDELNASSHVTVTGRPVDPALGAFAAEVLAASPGVVAYARVDTVPDPATGRPLLMELEVTEPYLFLSRAPEPEAAADLFARAVVTSLG
jgi:hypothetical protein